MKYYSIHFDNVEQLKCVMDTVFRLLRRNGINNITSSKQCEHRYDLVVGNELTFVCVVRTGIGLIVGLEILGSYSVMYNQNEEPDYVYEWIMAKYRYNKKATANYFNFVFPQIPQIKKVIFNDPATIVFWGDGSKTVVKAQDNDDYDPEKGLTMAITKKWFGNKGNYYNKVKKWLPKESEVI